MDTNIRKLLQGLAKEQKLAHAYLFSGNDNAAKNRIIESVFAAGNIHMADRKILESAEKEITIAQVRELSAFFDFSAWNSPYKVGVIYQADRMNQEAQSAFLKVLEEPKGKSVFFLLTAYPDMLFGTIRSRVQEHKFYRFQEAEIPAEAQKEFTKLQTANLHQRFAFAKKLAESPEEIASTLAHWIALLRQSLLQNAGTKEAPLIAQKIKTAQEVSYILQTSNVNPRPALERLLLDL